MTNYTDKLGSVKGENSRGVILIKKSNEGALRPFFAFPVTGGFNG